MNFEQENSAEQAKVQRTLFESEEKFRKAFEMSPDAYYIATIEEGIIVEINDAFERILGYSRKECVGKKSLDLKMIPMGPSDRQRMLTEIKSKGHFENLEFEGRRRNGEIFPFLYSGTILELNGNKHILGVIHDITERKRAEQAIQSSEKKYRQLFNSTPIGVLTSNSAGKIFSANQAAASMYGYERPEELIGLPITVLYKNPSNRRLLIKLLMQKGTFKDYILKMKRKDGTIITCSANIAVQRDSKGNIIEIQNIIRDVTQEIIAEKELRESREQLKLKLDSVLSPELEINEQELENIIDTPALEKLMDDLYFVTGIPNGIVDLKGKVLVGAGWQDICTKFHRVNPQTLKNCIESDVELTRGVKKGELRTYRCKNNLRDVVTPLFISEKQVANIFSGQFFLEDDVVDQSVFASQAEKIGFDKKTYLEALSRVPRVNRQKLDRYTAFLHQFTEMISKLSLSNLKLAKTLATEKEIQKTLRESEARLNRSQEIAHLGSWEMDIGQNKVTWSDEAYRIFGVEPQQFSGTYEVVLKCIHPDDREKIDTAYLGSMLDGKQPNEVEFRIIRPNTKEERILYVKFDHIRDASGNIVRLMGMIHDVTESRKNEEALRQSEAKYKELINGMKDIALVMDFNGNILDLNQAAVNVLGYTKEDLLSMGTKDIDKYMSEMQIQRIRDSPSEQSSQIIKTIYKTRSGREIPVEISSSKVTYQGKQAFLSIARDISERKEMQERLRNLAYQLNGLSAGGSYIFQSHERAFKAYADLAFYGARGLCIVREDPETVVNKYGILSSDLRILASKPLKGFSALSNLQSVSLEIQNFITEQNAGVVLLDGLEYLISVSGFNAVYQFIQEKRFDFLERGVLLIIPVDLVTLTEQEKALLSSELKIMDRNNAAEQQSQDTQ